MFHLQVCGWINNLRTYSRSLIKIEQIYSTWHYSLSVDYRGGGGQIPIWIGLSYTFQLKMLNFKVGVWLRAGYVHANVCIKDIHQGHFSRPTTWPPPPINPLNHLYRWSQGVTGKRGKRGHARKTKLIQSMSDNTWTNISENQIDLIIFSDSDEKIKSVILMVHIEL